MPTLLIKNGFRFFFFLSEPQFKAPHIHVEKGIGDGTAIFWLEPTVTLQKSRKLSAKDLSTARKIVLENQTDFTEKYYEFISPKHK
jgi:hypothetical protein